jgi:hypothetical protein
MTAAPRFTLVLGYGALRAIRNLTFACALTTPALAEPVTVVALGDSLTAGYGLPQEEGFVPQLQAWLAAQGQDVVVVNAGVSGDTTAGGLARLDWSLTPQVDAMIVTLGGNGSQIHVDGRRIDIPGVKADVVDPTGCGDAYRAGLLHGISSGMDWPKEMVAVFTRPVQSRQAGSSPRTSKGGRRSSISWRRPQDRQVA